MEIRRLAQKKGNFTKAEKDFLIAEGAKWGVEAPTKTTCSDCWRDMAIRIGCAMREAKPRTKGRRLWGRPAIHGVTFKGRTITNAEIDADPTLLEWMDANGFPQYLLRDED